MIQYIGDIITIWALVFAILIMLVLCTFTIQWSLKRDTKNEKSETGDKTEDDSYESGKLLE